MLNENPVTKLSKLKKSAIFLTVGIIVIFLFVGLTSCTSNLEEECLPGQQCGFVIDDQSSVTETRYPALPPITQISKFSFESSVKLCWRQPNYPMCSFDCINNPERQPWNDWCDAPPAPADKIINANEFTEAELAELLEELERELAQ
jgi:hypothetical protein